MIVLLKKMQRRNAFSLMEAVITLLILGFVIGIPSMTFKGYEEAQLLSQSAHNVMTELAHASYYATMMSREVSVVNARESHLLQFYYVQADRTTKIKAV